MSKVRRFTALGVVVAGVAVGLRATREPDPEQKFKEWWDVADKHGDMSDFDIPDAPVNRTPDGEPFMSTMDTVPVEP